MQFSAFYAAKQVLLHFRDRFIEEVDAIAIVFDLEHNKIITDGVREDIRRACGRALQNQILCANLTRVCTKKALITTCEVFIAVHGNAIMNQLGRDMKNMLLGKFCVHCYIPTNSMHM